ncbi:MAG: hypothetical protein KA419_12005 [Acidobacteria bacterium]|nr:hypothetical protein [Acidobacteriota bacterium]
MNCRALQRWIACTPEFRDEILARPEVRDHLRHCPGCARFAREEAALSRAIGQLPAVEAPAGFEDELRFRLAAAPETRAPRRGTTWVKYAAIAASAVLVILLTVLVGTRSTGPAPLSPSAAASPAPPTHVFRPVTPPAPLRPVDNVLAETRPVEIPLPATVTRKPAKDQVRLLSHNVDSGDTIVIEMPASYRIQNLRELEAQYIREVSY